VSAREIAAGQRGRLLAILERGYGVTEVTCRDMHLIAEALAGQSQRMASRARSKAYAGPGLAITRATLREQSDRLAELAAEFGQHAHEPVLVRCADSEARR
jgi:hypothetical protein